jgi:hypothetical protein
MTQTQPSMMTDTISLIQAAKPQTEQLVLRSYEGLITRQVSRNPARACTDDEIPIIDLANLDGDVLARKDIAKRMLSAMETTGFFYLANHGVPESVIENSLSQMKA